MAEIRQRPSPQRLEWLVRLTSYVGLYLVVLLAGVILVVAGNTSMQAIGTSLVASALIGLVLIFQFRLERQFEEARHLYDTYGLTGIVAERSRRDQYTTQLRKCEEQFDLLGQSLSRFFVDLGTQVLPLLDAKGVRMRLLILDPRGKGVALRLAEDPSPERTNLRAEIRKTAEAYRALALSNLDVRYYDCTPSVNYQRIDHVLYVGPYFVGAASSKTPALVLRAGGDLARAYQSHFDYIWDHSSRPA